MSIVFPEWTNSLPRVVGAVVGLAGLGICWGVYYYFTPKFWEVGYQPEQPVAYSHQIHAGKLGIDCRYCHTRVEEARQVNIPDTATCMNCHTGEVGVGGYLNSTLWKAHETLPALVTLRTSYAKGEPIRWKRVHKLPDYVQFNHAVHLKVGISCYSCHGRIDQLKVVRQEESLSMAFCLACHRNPEKRLVAASDNDLVHGFRITELWSVQQQLDSASQIEDGLRIAKEEQLEPTQSCGSCHY